MWSYGGYMVLLGLCVLEIELDSTAYNTNILTPIMIFAPKRAIFLDGESTYWDYDFKFQLLGPEQQYNSYLPCILQTWI